MRVFTAYMDSKYSMKQTDPGAIQAILRTIHTSVPKEAHADLERQITMDELQDAVKQGKPRKPPRIDGICNEFFLHTWEITKCGILTILNDMFTRNGILDSQNKKNQLMLMEIFIDINPSDHTMTLGSTQTLTEMNTRRVSWG
jgi:hypothetical protein